MSTWKYKRTWLWMGGIVLILVGVFVVIRHYRIQHAIATIEQLGGAISDDEDVFYTSGPALVTFDIPGRPSLVSDADAVTVCEALSRFTRLDRIDVSGTTLGDSFFVELAQRCPIRMVQLRHTRSGDRGVQALANNGATQELYLKGLALSDETLTLLERKGIRYER